ncbi:MAG: PAS domain-containing protein [Deltaproteobacteria bacterium]|nr:PAS domain-containing protein [Deltaproteobacteria bacterium]
MAEKPGHGAMGSQVAKPVETMAVSNEITRLLSKGGEGFAGICRAVTDHMSVIAKNHDILWVNDVAKCYFGRDLVGKKCHAAYHGAYQPCSPCIVESAFADAGVHEHETVVVVANGNKLNFLCTASPVIFDEDGRPMAVIEISRDITRQKKMERERTLASESLQKKERLTRAMLEATTDAVVLLDPDGIIVESNLEYACRFNRTREDMIGCVIWDLFPGPIAEKRKANVDSVFETGRPTTMLDERDGMWNYTNLHPVFDSSEKVSHVAVFAHDITDLKRIGDKLEQSRERLRNLSDYIETARERERTRIAREIHDDLGQVLTAVKIDVAWIKKRLGLDAGAEKKALGIMDLVDNAIRSVQRITSELRPPLLNDIGLGAALEWQVNDFAKRMGIRAEFKKNCDDHGLGEKTSVTLFRICQESLTNIARHSRASGAWVRLSKKKGATVLEIRDNGIGMSHETMTRDDAFGLMGIRERALTAGGTAEIKSTSGKGTRVVVRIPCTVS